MNIFILDLNVDKCAQMHCDRHLSKMILETAQMLCTSLTLSGVIHDAYLPTHSHHPCTRWATNLRNWVYLRSLGRALGKEFTYRYGKEHKSIGVINRLPIPEMTVARPKVFALAMPVEYHMYKMVDGCLELDYVKSYRNFYKSKQDRFKMVWSKRDVPSWFN